MFFALDPYQDAVASLREGAYVVPSGPGSGKTTVCVEWIARLLAAGVTAPSRVLFLSYTSAAGDELKARLLARIGQAAQSISAGTIHAHCLRWWRAAHPDDARATSNAVLGSARCPVSAWSTIPRMLKANGLSPNMSTEAILTASDRAREAGYKVGCENEDLIDFVSTVLPLTHRRKAEDYALAVVLWQQAKRTHGVIDFADMLYFVWEALAPFEGPAPWTTAVTRAFDVVILDEAQDASRIQLETVEAIAATAKIKALVFDLAQSLYSWRSAQPELLRARINAQGYRAIPLRYNYRSDQRIVRVYNTFANGRAWRVGEDVLWGSGIDGGPLAIEAWELAEKWDQTIVQDVQNRARAGTQPYPHVMILARTNTQLAIAQMALSRANIPYESTASSNEGVWGGYDGRSILGYLKACANAAGLEDLSVIANRPQRFLGRDVLRAYFAEGDVATVLDRISAHKAGAELSRDVGELRTFSWQGRCEAIAGLLNGDIADRDRGAGLRSDEDRMDLIERLCDEAACSGSLSKLQAEIENMARLRRMRSSTGKVRVSTFHSAKGLESETVYVLVDGLPHHRALDDDARDEEERLFYVGASRAKHRLVLVSAAGLESHPYIGPLLRDGVVPTPTTPEVDATAVIIEAARVAATMPAPGTLESMGLDAAPLPWASIPAPAPAPAPAPVSAPTPTTVEIYAASDLSSRLAVVTFVPGTSPVVDRRDRPPSGSGFDLVGAALDRGVSALGHDPAGFAAMLRDAFGLVVVASTRSAPRGPE